MCTPSSGHAVIFLGFKKGPITGYTTVILFSKRGFFNNNYVLFNCTLVCQVIDFMPFSPQN